MGVSLNSWTTLDDEGNFQNLGSGGTLKIGIDSQEEITNLTGYNFSTTQKAQGVVNTVKNDISKASETVSNTLSNFSTYAKYLPFVIVGLIILTKKKR